MWCAVHVKDGNEHKTENFVTNLLLGSTNARCFHLTRNRRKKYGGQWRTIQENLLPGYVFIDTDQPELVYKELKKTAKPNLLFSDDEHIAALKQHESDFMEQVVDAHGVIAISKIRIAEDGHVEYLSGPLTNVTDKVKKVNLHKRVAELEVDFIGQKKAFYLGIEIEQ